MKKLITLSALIVATFSVNAASPTAQLTVLQGCAAKALAVSTYNTNFLPSKQAEIAVKVFNDRAHRIADTYGLDIKPASEWAEHAAEIAPNYLANQDGLDVGKEYFFEKKTTLGRKSCDDLVTEILTAQIEN